MRNLILSTALLALAPFVFTFGLVFMLFSYNKNPYFAAALHVPQDVLAATDFAQDTGRVERVRGFLARYQSPLEPYAADIVNAAEIYGLDYRLIPAIAMQESGLCRKIPVDSYNCWGFGIYGGKVTYFNDYNDGIYTVTKALAVRYRNQGLVTPEQIMTMYTPNSNGSWAKSVNNFMEQL